MILKRIGAFFQSHKKKIALTSLIPFAGGAYALFQTEINAFKASVTREANIELTTSTPKVELHKKVNIEARIDSLGLNDLAPGTLSLEGDPQYLSIKPSRSVKLEAVSGSQPITNLPEVKAIKISPSPVQIVASYVSGDLQARSKAIFIEILEPVKVVRPHFDRSDTGRVNLSGEWTIDVGGDSGKMNIKQGTDDSITGTYVITGSQWPEGKITGYKDGATFRVHFSIPGKEKNQELRVAGHYDIEESKGGYIEIIGCAYHLRRSTALYNKVGAEGVDCSKPAYYNRWKVLQTATFHATSPFGDEDED